MQRYYGSTISRNLLSRGVLFLRHETINQVYQALDGRFIEVNPIRELSSGWPRGGRSALKEVSFTILFRDFDYNL